MKNLTIVTEHGNVGNGPESQSYLVWVPNLCGDNLTRAVFRLAQDADRLLTSIGVVGIESQPESETTATHSTTSFSPKHL